mgnify:CR=1 FL=1
MLYGHDQGKNIKQLSDDTNDVVCVKMGGTGKASHTANAVLTGNGEDAVKNVVTANGALYATAANNAPKFGTLPIAQGGTGKTTAAGALAALGGASIKKVWGNASPSSLFAPQDVAIAANEGDLIGIEFESQNSAIDRRITWLTVKAGMVTELVTVQSTSDGGNIFVTRRAVTITNTGLINFDKGYYRYVGASNNRHDGYSIPTAVYIAKGVI